MDIDDTVKRMESENSLKAWCNEISNIIKDENDDELITIKPKIQGWVTILEQYIAEIEQCYELIKRNCNDTVSESELKEFSDIISKSKYWTYGFYESDWIYKSDVIKINQEKLYDALIEFWRVCNRNFDDYKRAIEMLCTYYTGNYVNMSPEKRMRLIETFLHNVKYCGDKGDFGYCYQGINAMKANMGSLDDDLLEQIILSYEGDSIASLSQYRHQIFVMIDCLNEDKAEKKKWLKEFVLYGTTVVNIVLIVLTAEEILCDVYYDSWTGHKTIKDYMLIDNKCEGLDEALVLREDKWEVHTKEGRVYTIKIDSSNKTIYLNSGLAEEKYVPFNVQEFEWRLNDFIDNKKFRNQIRETIIDNKGIENQGNLLFSYLYLNGYRGIESCCISFDHKFMYEPDKKGIFNDNNEYFDTDGFYDKKIKSVSCIVGKNGAGKTSIIEFLGKTFSQIVSLYDNNKEKNYSQIIEELGLGKNIEFLVIFKYSKKYYTVSNIENIYDYTGKTEKYKRGFLIQNGEKNKVYFWSNKLELKEIFPEENKSKKMQYAIAQVDYTRSNDIQEAIYFSSEKSNGKSLNMLLIYQFMYLKHLFENQKSEIDLKDLTWENVNLYEALIDKAKYEKIECAIYKKSNKYKLLFYDRNVSWFKMSSGQDAKFTFEAKLYWALIGGQEFKNCYSDSLGKDSEQIDMSRCISKGDSAIIYIDEGDLYYHPEWQRQFMKSILDIVKLRKEECYLQLIVTSNSPYILSDFFDKDVIYIIPDGEECNMVKTFGQNIHTLLKSPFFMTSTIGCVAYSKISKVMRALSDEKYKTLDDKDLQKRLIDILYNGQDKNLNETELYNILISFIDNIGEEIYKIELEHILERVLSKQKEIDILMKQQKEIEQRLKFLQEDK